VKKEVDRKASKNRKIRYVVHDKILNFLVPLDNLKLLEGREAIVSNLFGVRSASVKIPKVQKSAEDV
jgi:protein AATF/BFR2